jgi:hypothetical protein
MTDRSDLRVAIIDAVTVTASVDTSLTFTVAGKTSGDVSGDTCTGSPTATTLPFGTLDPSTATVRCQTLSVATNALNGFNVTVQENQPLTASNGAIIYLFKDSASTTVATWTSPTAVPDAPYTYGHFGLTSSDILEGGAEFAGNKYTGDIVNPRTIYSHGGPADSSADIAYKIRISVLQPAATDYTNRLTYVATPIF